MAQARLKAMQTLTATLRAKAELKVLVGWKQTAAAIQMVRWKQTGQYAWGWTRLRVMRTPTADSTQMVGSKQRVHLR